MRHSEDFIEPLGIRKDYKLVNFDNKGKMHYQCTMKNNESDVQGAFQRVIQELKIRENELDEEIRQAKKRAEEAGYEAFNKIDKMFEVAVLSSALGFTDLTALNVINSM
ncbi:MAG: hypothetical protein ACLFR0_09645 [Alphaproteobacteria bacterium]